MKEQSAAALRGPQPGKPFRHSADSPDVQSITNAAEAHSQEMRGRMIKYGTTMAIRMVCIAAIFFVDGWFKIIPVIGAVILPWVAVMIANGGADITKREEVELLDQAPLYELPSPVVPETDPATIVLTGEFIVEDETESDPAQASAQEPEAKGESA